MILIVSDNKTMWVSLRGAVIAVLGAIESISVRRRKDEKDCFPMICDEIDTSPSPAIRMLVTAINCCEGYLFDSSHPYGFSQEVMLRWMIL